MNCETLQFDLSLFVDHQLSLNEIREIEDHLAACPLCRTKLDEYREIQTEFRNFARPVLSSDFQKSIKSAILNDLLVSKQKEADRISISEFFRLRLMPYGVGVLVSCLFFAFFLNSLLNLRTTENFALQNEKPKVAIDMLKLQTPTIDRPVDTRDFEPITASVYASRRVAVSKESPSVNPTGALIALANTLIRDDVKQEEIVLVADVFGDGIARISSFIEAPRDPNTLRKLEAAFQNDAQFAPFVPADLDNRSETVQIVLLLNQVDIYESKRPAKLKKR